MMTAGAIDPAQAFMLLAPQEEPYSVPQEQTSQPTVKNKVIPAIQAQTSQKFYPHNATLKTLAQQQMFDQLSREENQDAFSFLIRTLAPIFIAQSQDGNNNEETNKLRTQLIDFLQEFNATRQDPKNNAPVQAQRDNNYQALMNEIGTLKEEIKLLQAPKNNAPLQEEVDQKHHALMEEIRMLKEKIIDLQAQPQEAQFIVERQVEMPALLNDNVILPREEFERLNAQISTLTAQIEHLEYSQRDLMDSISSFHAKKNDKALPEALHSSALRPINTLQYNEKTLGSDNSEGKLTAIGNTPTSEEASPEATVLPGATTPLSSDGETPSLSTNSPLTNQNALAALPEQAWGKEVFEQNVLGIKPTNLIPMSETETDLWRAFTVLKFTSEDHQSLLSSLGSTPLITGEEQAAKPWSTWGGAFSTAELEAKFKSNPFMERAFKDITALHLAADAPIFFPKYAEYFVLSTPNLELDPKTDADLINAYYFRGLYKVLTGDNCAGRTNSSIVAKFEIDLKTGIKGGRFNYGLGLNNSSVTFYETSIYDAEAYFKDTPWHKLFINKVIQATLDSLPNPQRKAEELAELYNKDISKLQTVANLSEAFDLYDHSFKTTESDTQDSTVEFSRREVNKTIFALQQEKDEKIDAVYSQVNTILKASSLREIDEALGFK